VQTLAKRVAVETFAEAVRVIKLLRWRQAIDGPLWPFEHHSLYWRTSGDPFHGVPLEQSKGSEGRSPAGITWRDNDEPAFLSLWSNTNVTEPLGHELLREAHY
jgi:hypothetical protein